MIEIVKLFVKDSGLIFAQTSDGKIKEILCDVPDTRNYGNLIASDCLVNVPDNIESES